MPVIISERSYPQLPDTENPPERPISFLVVRYSDDYLHNFLRSECIGFPINEIVEVDNTGNLYFDNLSEAIRKGMALCRHDLVAIVHEDVLLPKGWQQQFERSLSELERTEKNWGVLGAVGWTVTGRMLGHWSDPHQYQNFFLDQKNSFSEVFRLDEQILILHKSRLPDFDVDMPGIHHLGLDLSNNLRKKGFPTYVVDAPTIHKYADEKGQLIFSKDQSPKITDRGSLTYLAERACCNEYSMRKYPDSIIFDYEPQDFSIIFEDADKIRQLESPVILISRGGSGSRLLSLMAADCGVFLGNELNASGDSMEMVRSIYQGIIEQYQCRASWQKELTVPRIKAAAAKMIAAIPSNAIWGFKLPESIYLLREMGEVFPRANYVHLVRDPLSTCIRRTHMTARLDNHIGRITLPAAYDAFGFERKFILRDHPAVHMAYTTLHQLSLIEHHLDFLPKTRARLLKFEQIIKQPNVETRSLSDWLQCDKSGSQLEQAIDVDRIGKPPTDDYAEIIDRVSAIVMEQRKKLNYA
ncbi:MAG: sulfotransferase [Gammaproteobacteria bacterium]